MSVRPGDEVFHGCYAPGGMGSGPGAHPDFTRDFRDMLQRFLVDNKIRSVLDYGCGDWQWAKLVNWGDQNYLGVDIVPHLIDRIRQAHGNERIRFEAIHPESWTPPAVDLVICKDVLQHLSNAEAVALARKLLAASKHALFINDRPRFGEAINGDTPRGGYRPIDMSKPPFALPGRVVYEFKTDGSWDKIAFWAPGTTSSLALHSIPRIVHHLWPGNDEFPQSRTCLDGTKANFHTWRLSWMTHHPDWSFRFQRLEPTGDDRMDRVLADRRYSVVVKADVLRWFVLMKFGGVYVDTDFECLAPMTELMQDPTGFFAAREPPIWANEVLSPALMASMPGHPFAETMFAEALQRLDRTPVDVANKTPNDVTGPWMMESLANGRSDITIHPSYMFYRESPVPVGCRRYAQTWWTGTRTKEGWVHGVRLG